MALRPHVATVIRYGQQALRILSFRFGLTEAGKGGDENDEKSEGPGPGTIGVSSLCHGRFLLLISLAPISMDEPSGNCLRPNLAHAGLDTQTGGSGISLGCVRSSRTELMLWRPSCGSVLRRNPGWRHDRALAAESPGRSGPSSKTARSAYEGDQGSTVPVRNDAAQGDGHKARTRHFPIDLCLGFTTSTSSPFK